MGSIGYRELHVSEAELLESIDRSESIDGIYSLRDGALTCVAVQHEVISWTVMYDRGKKHVNPALLTDKVARLKMLMSSGGAAFGAWDVDQLVGLGSLGASAVGGNPAVLKLDMLHVSCGYRGRGIGRGLTDLVASRARSLGAETLYISSAPTRATVDVYRSMGAVLLERPDPELLALEPDDIHLALSLA